MVSLEEILVATDLTEESSSVFSLAREIAETTGAKLVLVTVVDVVSALGAFWGRSPEFSERFSVESLARRALAQAAGALRQLATRHGLARAETIVVEGHPPARHLVRVAADRGSDLLLLATHVDSPEARTFLGATTERVLRTAPCPVLTVRRSS